jgi:hypothetical protein
MFRPLAFARESRGDAEAGEPDFARCVIHQDMRRFDILMDETALVGLAQGSDDADGELQEAFQLKGGAEQPLERLATRILKHQQRPTAFAHQLQRSHRPRSIEFVLQFEFVSEPIEAGR